MRKPLSEFKAYEHSAELRETLRAEIRDEFAALERYEARHGSFPELARAEPISADR
jgi:hypothetical protein